MVILKIAIVLCGFCQASKDDLRKQILLIPVATDVQLPVRQDGKLYEEVVRMKKILLTGLLLAVVLCLTACRATGPEARGLHGTVNTEGSTSMADVMAALQEGFREKEPGVTVNFSGTGSGAGIEAALSGACDIGLSSRELKDSEIQKGAKEHLAALDGIALVVHAGNPITELSMEQLADIFTGKITNWRDLGGSDAPIAPYGREAGSGTRSAFEELTGTAGRCTYRNEYGSTGDVIGNVSANPNAIGYVSLASVRGGVTVVTVDGAACTEETVQDGTYPIRRPFLLVTSQDAPLSEAAQAFLEYALSPEVADYIARAGAIAP